MKHDWEYKKLGEVCDVSAGQGAPQGEQSYCEKGTPFIKAGNLEDLVNGLDEGSVQNVSQSIAQKHKLKLYKAGSVLFAKSGMSCMKGYVHVLQRDCYVVSHLAILTPQTIDGHFLKYYLRFTKTYSLVKDEAYPSISLSDIASFPVPVPPLPTQRAIVAELDTLNEILDKKRQQLKELDTLAQSIFYDMFGDPDAIFEKWGQMDLIGVCDKIVDCPHTTPIKAGVPTPYPCIRTSELKGGIIHWDSMQYVFEEEYQKRVSRLMPKAGDIIYGREGSFGDAVILPEGWQFCLGQRTMLFRANNSIVNNSYLHRALISEVVLSQAKDKNVASTVAHVNVKDIKRFKIPIPPLPLQQSFARKVEAIEKQKELINASIKEVEMLFNATMDKYFG